MTAPVITFDKPGYTQGQTITATVTYTAPVVDLTVSSAIVGTVTASAPLLPAWTATDTGNRKWSQVSDNGTQAVFTATA